LLVSVGHKPKSISQLVRIATRGFDRHRPHGVAHGLQITSHKSEPFSRARNLLSKDDCRLSLLDEPIPFRPQVPVVGESFLLPREREWLTGAASGPNFNVCWPARDLEREWPARDTGEEVALSESFEVIGLHFLD
jgi:hypothetical protein